MQGTWWDSCGWCSTYTHRGGDNKAGTEGDQPPINGLRVAYQIGTGLGTKVLGAQELYKGSHGYDKGWQSMSVPYSV